MENKLIFQLEQQLANLDIDSHKLDAIIQLKTWQNKMRSVIEKIYFERLNEIETIALHITEEIKEKQRQLEQMDIKDNATLLKLQDEIDQLKSSIIIDRIIPENFQQLIERTIRVKRDDNDDDDMVIIDINKHDDQVIVVLPPPSTANSENRVSKIFNSESVQQALAMGLAQTLTHMGTMAVTSTTTIAATTIAKTALFTTAYGIGTLAYGMGRMAMGTTKKVWSLVI